MAEVLTPDSSRWGEFCERLDNKLGRFGCDADRGRHVHRRSKSIMRGMGGVDIPATLEFFRGHGGYCDCEVLLNVDAIRDVVGDDGGRQQAGARFN